MPGTEGYENATPEAIEAVDRIRFDDHHRSVLHLVPDPPARVLDVGSCTGRDAAALASLGLDVYAVEPMELFRDAARALHPSAGDHLDR